MISILGRKARQVLNDPVLRFWLLRRIVGLEKKPPIFTQRAPPYLTIPSSTTATSALPVWCGEDGGGAFSPPTGKKTITLPGMSVEIYAETPGSLFDINYPDLETMLGAHRFAWVPLAGSDVNPDWVDAIWRCWVKKFGTNQTGWPWHAYSAGERAINIIDFAAQHSLPGDRQKTIKVLADHADIIRNNLEYFGEEYTSNHLSNNGRSLLRIGLALGLEEYVNDGAKILITEANRIFGCSGLLNEGSSHYHLLITRNYIDAWIAARNAGLEQTAELGDIAERAIAAISVLCLPGGMPLIGDISPDAPPRYFSFLSGAGANDTKSLSVTNSKLHKASTDLLSQITPPPLNLAAADGWHHFEVGAWRALAYVSPDGWPPMPGHGHDDLGSFELHDGETPVLIDPGRGSYINGEYTKAEVHNSVIIDGNSPSPINRPYYNKTFRRRIIKQPPEFTRTHKSYILRSYGFSRMAGIGTFERKWHFNARSINIVDRIDGIGTHRIERRYFTPADVETGEEGLTLTSNGRRWRIRSDTQPTLIRGTRWVAYGDGAPATIIIFRQLRKLPCEETTILERV